MPIIIIPARYASSRFPGKPLVSLRDSSGIEKSLIQRTYEAAMRVGGVDAVWIATDDDRIAHAARDFGGSVLMTSIEARNGTERCAEALAQLPAATDLVINLQGDAPLTPPAFVEALIGAMAGDTNAAMATPVFKADAALLQRLQADRRAGLVGATTAVFGAGGAALYFSKEVLPHQGKQPQIAAEAGVYLHVGVYAYRPEALRAYAQWSEGRLEAREGLEQLRFLENGARVLCCEVEAPERPLWELNNPVDVARIEAAL